MAICEVSKYPGARNTLKLTGRFGREARRHAVPTCDETPFRLLYEPIMTDFSGRNGFGSLTQWTGFALAIGLASAVGCSSAPKPLAANPGSTGQNVQAPPPVDRNRCKSDGKHIVAVDNNQDKKPDGWKYFVPNGQGAEVMTCRQVDLNFDGKVDITYYYDEAGASVALDEVDLDYDGRVDLTTYYTGGRKVRQEQDTNLDGQSDVWKFFEDSKLVRIEMDTDFNGKADHWEYYEGGKLDRIGYDTTGSGRVDRWDRSPDGADDAADATAAAQAAAAATPKAPVAAAMAAPPPAATVPVAPATAPATPPAPAAPAKGK